MTSEPLPSNRRLEVQNLIIRTDVGYHIDLDGLSSSPFFESISTYEPEVFRAAIVRHPDITPIVALVFETGRIVFTGSKTKRAVNRALDIIEPELVPFAIHNPVMSDASDDVLPKRCFEAIPGQ